ncbi:hypothetical protein [Halorubrum sp. T3]|uniref:hypothetical protein n=1 Tax=Halorubrum sp. T3 TaxID=1194088 RepID=UPI000A9A8841|nr:hypothetical protein [Halorubrum sp. T3]
MANNHDYEEPKPGMTDWHVPINENFGQLDSDVEVRDREENIGEYEPKDGAKFYAVDTGASYYGDGSSWNGPIAVKTREQRIGRTKHLSEGADLGELISNAVADDYTSIHIHEHEDGSEWSWNSDYTHDTNESALKIVAENRCTIDYTGDGRPLTIVDSSGWSGENDFHLEGGHWITSGNPTEWLRVDDQVGYRISPNLVDYYNTNATAVQIRNDSNFSELGVIEGDYKAGNGIEFVPASVTGGTGTDSFQGTTIRDVRINVSNDADPWEENSAARGDGFGIWLRGNMKYCSIRRPNIFPNGANAQAMRINTTRASGMTIQCLQAETSSGADGTVAVLAGGGDAHYYSPLFISPQFYNIEHEYKEAGYTVADPPFSVIKASAGGGVELGTSVGSVRVNGERINGKLEADFSLNFNGDHGSVQRNSTEVALVHEDHLQFKSWNAIEYAPVDVTTLSPSQGWVSYHNGNGSNTEGPAFYNGSAWRSLVDNSVIH